MAADHPGVDASIAPAPDRLTGVAERVRVTITGVGAVDAAVVRAVPGAAELLLLGPPPAPARLLHRRAAWIGSLPPAAPDGCPATLIALPDARGQVRPDLVLALLGDAADPPDAVAAVPTAPDRRAAIRVSLVRPVSIWHPGSAVALRAQVADVSVAGLAVHGAPSLARGDLVRLRLLLDRPDPLDVVGEVRLHAGAGHGLQLVRMRPQDRLWLERWLDEQSGAGTSPSGVDVLA